MWKLIEVYAQNICAFRELSFKPQQGVTTLIFGDNRDNESQRSNGSGKSALIECIALGITGSSLRKVKNEEIINDNSQEAYVELTFKNESLCEVFVIERRIFKRGASQVCCRTERNGKYVEGEGIQPCVELYNGYILNKLGIRKSELFNNFILSKYRYQDFLSCSDREKKDIINQFSNGVLVDQAIEHILEDKVPLEKVLKERELEVAECNGRLKVISEQIEECESQLSTEKELHQHQIKEKREAIASKKELIRSQNVREKRLNTELCQIKEADASVQALEESDKEVSVCIETLIELFSPLIDEDLSGWNDFLKKKESALRSLSEDLQKSERELTEAENQLKDASLVYETKKGECDKKTSRHIIDCKSLDGQEEALKKDTEENAKTLSDLRVKKRGLHGEIEQIRNSLAGTISCPECGYIFLVSDKSFNPVAARKSLQEKELELGEVNEQIEKLLTKRDEADTLYSELKSKRQTMNLGMIACKGEVSEAEQKEQNAKDAVLFITRRQADLRENISTLTHEVQNFRHKVFDEAYELLDEVYKGHSSKVKSLKEEVAANKASLDTMKKTLEDLLSHTPEDMIKKLRVSLKKYNEECFKAEDRKKAIENELWKLSELEKNFTSFKTYLANSKIEALSQVTNEFLKDIGSDIRIRFSGYTVLKSGKVRERISISLIREGIDCGSFGKFSAGEAARVNLATILAMQKLINTNAEDGKGLDLLILDEILEAVDEDGLSFMFKALNQIGTTTLVVSHGNIAESYPYTIKIIKENGESRIEE